MSGRRFHQPLRQPKPLLLRWCQALRAIVGRESLSPTCKPAFRFRPSPLGVEALEEINAPTPILPSFDLSGAENVAVVRPHEVPPAAPPRPVDGPGADDGTRAAPLDTQDSGQSAHHSARPSPHAPPHAH